MHQLVYVSAAAKEMRPQELLGMLAGARERNKAAGITGMLLYKNGHFMQVIEGSEDAVGRLFVKLCNDPRHGKILVLFEGEVPERMFPDFSMAFHDLGAARTEEVPGYSDFLACSFTDAAFRSEPSRAHALLNLFRHAGKLQS